MLREEVDVIVEMVAQNEMEGARERLNRLVPEVSSEYGRGAILALNGIMNVISSKSTDKMADREKILRAAERIPKAQTVDDMDKGYMQTISKWAKKSRAPAAPKEEAPRDEGSSVPQ